MFWIGYRNNEPIPAELKYPDWQTNKDFRGYPPLAYWIKYIKNEPIPDELKYPGW